jgi:hypothetical protein
LATHRAPVRGQVFGPRGPLFLGSKMEALMVLAPVYLPDDFFLFVGDCERVLFPWMMPISAEEAQFVRIERYDAFESILDQTEIDLLDPYRVSLC